MNLNLNLKQKTFYCENDFVFISVDVLLVVVKVAVGILAVVVVGGVVVVVGVVEGEHKLSTLGQMFK